VAVLLPIFVWVLCKLIIILTKWDRFYNSIVNYELLNLQINILNWKIQIFFKISYWSILDYVQTRSVYFFIDFSLGCWTLLFVIDVISEIAFLLELIQISSG